MLKSTLPKTILDRFRTQPEEVANDYHLTVGLDIRNNWIRSSDSEALLDYFEKLGIYAFDDMSGIILTSLWRDLHSQPIRSDEQVREYKRFWFYNAAQVTEKRSLPDDVWNKVLPVFKGATIKLADFKGSIIIIVIVTDDLSSPLAISYLNSLCNKFSKRDMQIVGIQAFPLSQKDRETFMRDNQPLFPIGVDPLPDFMRSLQKALISPGGPKIPATILIGKDGNMITRFNDWDPKTTQDLLYKAILNAMKSQPKAPTQSKVK